MSTTQPTHETVTEAPTPETIHLERNGAEYTYIGVDATGAHHHFDERTETVYVTDTGVDETLDGIVVRYRVVGEIDHTETLAAGRDLSEWVDYVAHERGWDDLQLTTIDAGAALEAV